MKNLNGHKLTARNRKAGSHMFSKVLASVLLLAAIGSRAADVTVYDSVVSLATNGNENYTFTDLSSGQSVVIAVTMSPYSPSDPTPGFSALDDNTHVGVDSQNGLRVGMAADFSATLVSASSGVGAGSITFGVAGIGIRPVEGGGTINWTSSSSSTSVTYSNSTQIVQALDTTNFDIDGATYSGQLVFPGDALFQLSDDPAPGQSLVFNVTFLVTNVIDPRTNSWFTAYSGKYARIYTNNTMLTNGVTLTTWSNGSETQSSPAYCGVQDIYSSSNFVYVRSTGLAGYNMGPWMNGSFPNLPANQHLFYRFPRTNGVPTAKSLTEGGQIGIFVDGVEMFNSWDAFYWNGTTDTNGQGTGYWNRDAFVNEGATFDPGYAHQQNTGTYHYHASPIALRYQLGDHVNYNSATKSYSEDTNAVTKHSPILAWVGDGFPVYGPYGYSNPTNANSGVRRMISGYIIRNGQFGTSNLTANGRTTIPQWAVRAFGVLSNQSGPGVSSSYPLGRYMEDNDYLGDHGYVQGVDFDLDEYNCRWCITPEFPKGTYAYFVSIASNGTPTFPYNIGRAFFGSAVGGSVSSISETVVTNFVGGPDGSFSLGKPVIQSPTVTLAWSSVDGGTYQVQSSSDLNTWTTNVNGVASQGTATQTNLNSVATTAFYRVARTALAAYDSVTNSSTGGGGGGGGQGITITPNSGIHGQNNISITVVISSSANPPPPQHTGAPVQTFTIGSINVTGASYAYSSTTGAGTISGTLSIPVGATLGPQTVSIVFPPPMGQTTGASYTITGGFNIN